GPLTAPPSRRPCSRRPCTRTHSTGSGLNGSTAPGDGSTSRPPTVRPYVPPTSTTGWRDARRARGRADRASASPLTPTGDGQNERFSSSKPPYRRHAVGRRIRGVPERRRVLALVRGDRSAVGCRQDRG